MKRWIIYLLVGLFLGIFDFYYQEITSGIVHSYISWFLIAWAIWLIPSIPIIFYELKKTKSKIIAALANAFTWAIAIFSYYSWIAIKLMFIGQASRAEMHITNYKKDWYWGNVKSVFLDDVLGGIGRWIAVAVIGGFIFGFLLSSTILYLKCKKKSHSML